MHGNANWNRGIGRGAGRWVAVLACALAVWSAGSAAHAGKYNKALSVGDSSPAWSGLTGIDPTTGDGTGPLPDHKTLDMAQWKEQVIVVAFTCNECVVAKDHEARLVALAEKFFQPNYKGKVALVAINSSAGKKEALDAMRTRFDEKKFNFPYLKDDTGLIGKSFGAMNTPEFFVIAPDRKVVYMGTLDDDSNTGEKATKHYVAEAVDAALAGKAPAVTETPPVGCLIKYPKLSDLR